MPPNPGRSAAMPSKEDLEDGLDPSRDVSPWRIFALAKPEWKWLALGLVLLALSLTPYLLLPVVFGRILDSLENGDSADERRREMDGYVVFLLVVLAIGSLFAMARSFIFNTAGERVVARLRIQLFNAILSQEIGLFDKRKTGELLSRLSSDTTSLQDVATSQVSMFFRGTIQLLFNAALMGYTSWKLTIVVFGVVPVVMVAIAVYARIVRKIAVKYSDALGLAADTAQESISNVRTMRSFAGEVVEVAKYTRSIGDPDLAAGKDPGACCWVPGRPAPGKAKSAYAVGVHKQAVASTFISFVGVAGFGAFILVVWYGSRLVISGELSVGDLVAFMLYSVQIGASIGMMSGLVGQLFVAIGASKRTFQLIDREPKIPISGGLVPEKAINGTIEFEHVFFSYPSRTDVQVLNDVSFSVPVNNTYAFVGTSGAGKSTILALLERFYEPSAGRVLVDGHDVADLDPRYLRSNVSLVAQEPVLFGVSIAANIAYGYAASRGDPDAQPSDAEVQAAAKAAFADEFILNFPEGYQTMVGERGVRLSGGQKQRIAIARALLVDPRILLLDEATSALDAESEHVVQKAINVLMQQRTTLVVAHRLSTVRNADAIVVLKGGGKIDSIGPHDDLMAGSTVYADLVSRQLAASTSSIALDELAAGAAEATQGAGTAADE